MLANHRTTRTGKRGVAVAAVALTLFTLGAAVIGSTIGTGTANACATASPPASVDCDGIQHGEMSPSTWGAVDGHDWIDGQGVEDYDGTQGEYCGAAQIAIYTIPRC